MSSSNGSKGRTARVRAREELADTERSLGPMRPKEAGAPGGGELDQIQRTLRSVRTRVDCVGGHL